MKTPAPPSGFGAAAAAWWALGVLIATNLFGYVDRQIINLVSPTFQKDLGITDLQLGFIQGLGLALFASAASYPVGWLADRFGRRRVLGVCIMVWSISTGACAFQNDFLGLLIATSGVAIGEAALTPIVFSMIPDIFPPRRRELANIIFFGCALFGVSVGLSLGGATLALLEKSHHLLPGPLGGMESWRTALILVAAPGPLFAALVTTMRARSHTDRDGTPPQKTPYGSDILAFLRRHWRPFAAIYGSIFVYNLPLAAAFAWLPVAIPRAFAGTPPSAFGVQMGLVIAIGSVVGLLIPILCSRWLSRKDPGAPLGVGAVFVGLAAIPSALLPFANQPWQIYASVGCQFTALLAAGAMMPGVIQRLSPPLLRSRLTSFIGICAAIAQGVAPIAVGAMSGWLDPHRGLLVAIAAISLPAWGVAAWLMAAAVAPSTNTIAELEGPG